MRTRPLLAVLVLASLSASYAAEPAKPAVGGEILVAPEAGATQVQLRPAVAFNGEVYLVVWQDGAGVAGRKECEIWAACLDKSGKPLDAGGILVCKAEGAEMRKNPTVAACGKDFLVVWEDYRNGKDYDLYAARVTGEGKVLNPNGFLVSGAPGVQVMPAVASDGRTGWLVTWSDFRSGTDYDVYAARISADGRLLDANGLAVATGRPRYPSQWISSVAWGDGAYLLTWRTGQYTFLCRVTLDGRIANALSETGGLEDTAYNRAGKTNWGITGNASISNRAVIASGAEGCIAVCVTPFGKSSVYTGPTRIFAFLFGRDGKPRVLANKEGCPANLFNEEWGNPGWAVEPVPTSAFSDTKWRPCAAPLGKDFLAVMTRRTMYDRNVAGSVDREDIVACRVELDGTCPDRKTGWIQVDATPGYNKSWPNVCGGPEGECLVVYERDKAVGDHKIAARVVRKAGSRATGAASPPARPAAMKAPVAPSASTERVPAPSPAPVAARPLTPEQAARGLFSLAMSYKRAGRADKAREYLKKIVATYSGTEYATRAERELGRM